MKLSTKINHCFWHFDFENGIFLQLYTNMPKTSQLIGKKVTKK